MNDNHWFCTYDHFCLQDICPEISKMKIPSSEFCLISGDWDELEIPNFV